MTKNNIYSSKTAQLERQKKELNKTKSFWYLSRNIKFFIMEIKIKWSSLLNCKAFCQK
jgi:hypothetical protein